MAPRFARCPPRGRVGAFGRPGGTDVPPRFSLVAALAERADAATPLAVRVGGGTVSALLLRPSDAVACYVFAHGAGAGMRHPFMSEFAVGLAERRIATLRYQFPFAERGSKRVDSPADAQATVRAAVDEAAARVGDLPLVAGGKSFGGRMTSQAQALSPLPGVRGLVFVGFPLHPAGRPATERAEHLTKVLCPMLFLQGTRDELAEVGLVSGVCAKLGPRATLELFDDADHSFHVRARAGRTDAQVRAAMLDAVVAWLGAIVQPPAALTATPLKNV